MKAIMEIGEYAFFDKKRFKCIPGGDCECCDYGQLYGKRFCCSGIHCKAKMRKDRRNVIFVLKKEEGGYRAYTKEEARRVYGDK